MMKHIASLAAVLAAAVLATGCVCSDLWKVDVPMPMPAMPTTAAEPAPAPEPEPAPALEPNEPAAADPAPEEATPAESDGQGETPEAGTDETPE